MQFSELLSMEGVREECDLRGPFGFMAFHGGELEQVTDVIARAIVHDAPVVFYRIRDDVEAPPSS